MYKGMATINYTFFIRKARNSEWQSYTTPNLMSDIGKAPTIPKGKIKSN